jgi:hypothetical protein
MNVTDHFFSLHVKFFTGEDIARNWILLLLMNVCAASYLWLCFHLRSAGIARRAGFLYFVAFLTIESWLLGFLTAPSQFSVWTAAFALLAAPLLLLVSSIALSVAGEKSVYDWVALVTGFAYPAVLVCLFATGVLAFRM